MSEFDIIHIQYENGIGCEARVVPNCTYGQAVRYVEDQMANGKTTGRVYQKTKKHRWEHNGDTRTAIEIRPVK